MKRLLPLALTLLLFTACKKETEKTDETTKTTVVQALKLALDTKEYSQRSKVGCRDTLCTYVRISVPEASGMGEVSDSINNRVFHVVRSIVYFGEKPTNAKSYNELMTSFIKSYEELKKDFAESFPWEAKIKARVDYMSDSIINIKMNNYMFTGGAHGYEGNRSLLFDAKTGRSLNYDQIFKNKKAFTAFAEKKFREKYKIAAGKSINSTGLMFVDDKFILPQNIFYTDKGLLLLYNAYEVASFADGTKELVIPYSEANAFLKVK
ncbi:DUF3298 and DUF4163 domain-containing protein [Flavobacterium hauense]